MDLSARLIDAYRETTYRVSTGGAEIAFRIGERSAALDALLAEQSVSNAIFITACNPQSERTDDDENQRRMDGLTSEIRFRTGRTILHGVGEGEGWSEPSLLVPGADIALLLSLMKNYRQHAGVYIEQGKAPELILAPQAGEVVHAPLGDLSAVLA
jgi:hypothetical protein